MHFPTQTARTPGRHAVAATALLSAAIAGCGGSSGDDAASAPAVTPAATTVAVPVTVIDGAINSATVCLDKNKNGVCDPGEPAATSNAAGLVTLTVAIADAGLYPVVAMIDSKSAVDADHGAVPVSYVMQAPADKASLISPLTTLVKAQQDDTGATTADAAAAVRAQAGLAFSPLDNYASTPATDANALAAAALARLVVLATQAQVMALASTVGKADISGATVSTTDLQLAAIKALLGALPALGSAAATAGITASSTPAAIDAALAPRLATLVANGQAGLTADSVAVAVGAAKLPADTTATTPVASAALRALTFTDVNNWFTRTNQSTAADNTPDANGKLHWYDTRTQDVAGTLTSWGFSSIARQGDLHWNGSAWTGCGLGFRNANTPRDANGRSSYDFCDKLEIGTSQRSGVDIAGKTLASVIGTIRAFPGGDAGVAYAAFGPSDLGLLGTATFPAGSTLYYSKNVYGDYAYAYDVQSSAIVGGYPAAIAAGGDASGAAGTTPAACAVITNGNAASYFAPVKTLEALVAANPGTPCVYGPTTSGLPIANEWWTNSSVSMGTIAGALTPPSTTVFTTTEALRVAFVPGGNVARYLSCLVRASDGSSRTCTEIGRGTYAIQTLGDARVLTLANLPAEAIRLGYARVFVERAGNVYFGYQTYGGTTASVRLNLPAANALLARLGMPILNPQ